MNILPVGLSALLVELDGQDEVWALHAELLRRRDEADLPKSMEIVPGARTVLLDGVTDPRGLARELHEQVLPPVAPLERPLVVIPTVYDGEDLEDVAMSWGVHVSDVAGIHSGHELRVAFLGFAPGFAYLTGLPEGFRVPRRPTPRPAVRAGSVGLAGEFTGVYPRATPGGWQLIGHTDVTLWDGTSARPSPFELGTRVRFIPAA
jgi:KipI family sensor histidine kinase inhibitor